MPGISVQWTTWRVPHTLRRRYRQSEGCIERERQQFFKVAIPLIGYDKLLVLAPFNSAYIPFYVHDWVFFDLIRPTLFMYTVCINL